MVLAAREWVAMTSTTTLLYVAIAIFPTYCRPLPLHIGSLLSAISILRLGGGIDAP